MNQHESGDALGKTLRAWELSPAPNPHFRPEVWRKIRADGQTSWAAYSRAHAFSFALILAATFGASGWLGHAVSRARLEAQRDQMVTSYLAELDPRVHASLPPSHQ